ncbi:MAG: hypothetical protein JWM32_1285 [Verrucomicrobia bacterium]|nr:hypothetical protein [Verrucomicrobiota bacterium]
MAHGDREFFTDRANSIPIFPMSMMTVNGLPFPTDVAAEYIEAADMINKDFGNPHPKLDYKTLMVMRCAGPKAQEIADDFRLAILVGKRLHQDDGRLPNTVLR